MPAFSIGHRHYKTKGDAIAHVRRVLHDTPINVPMSGEDESLILDLLKLHPHYALKTQHGISGIVVRLMPPYFKEPNRGFCVKRPDGGKPVEFSYTTCFGRGIKSADTLAAAKEAMRLSVGDWVNSHKDAVDWNSAALCPGSSGSGCRYESVMTREDSHVHHEGPPFAEIAEAYLQKHGIPQTQHKSPYGFQFVSEMERSRWVSYHNQAARLIVICLPCHKDAHRSIGPIAAASLVAT